MTELEITVPTNKQRISAVILTTAIIFAGGWSASLLSPATASEADRAEKKQAVFERTREDRHELPLKGIPSSIKSVPENSISNTSMKVTISGIRNSSGNIYIALFDDTSAFDNYDYMRAIDFRELPARAGSISVDFSNLEDKPYAVSLFHDENANQQFDMVDGRPLEGYGTSRATSAHEELKFHQASIRPASANIGVFYTD